MRFGPQRRSDRIRIARISIPPLALMTVRELANRAGVNKNTISRYEAGHEIVSSALHSIEAVLRAEGVTFLEDERALGVLVRIPYEFHAQDNRQKTRSTTQTRRLKSGNRP